MAGLVASIERPSGGSGQISFGAVVYTDIEDSTPLWERHPSRMPAALARHNQIIESAIAEADGGIVKNLGDGVLAVFDDVASAVGALIGAQSRLTSTVWDLDGDALRIRMAIDAGEIEARGHDVAGPVVNRCSRIMDVARGGQIVISDAVAEALGPAGPELADLGEFSLKGVEGPVGLHRVVLETDVEPPSPDRYGQAGFGRRIRGFELWERIGAGAAGEVYRARQESVDRDVAIKLIKPEFANDRRFVRQFETEAQFVARLEHPGVAHGCLS